MNNENLKEQLIQLLHENKVELSSEDKGILDDVFNDFEFSDAIDDSINIYFKDDLETFEEDLTITNVNSININGGSTGHFTATYTYTDEILYIVNEHTDLVYNGEVIEVLVDIDTHEARTKVTNQKEIQVVVTEQISYGEGDYSRIPRLYVYIPSEPLH